MTKILAVGDIHGDTSLTKKLAKRAKKEKVDLVILAGDLTLMEISTKDIMKPFIKEKQKVLIIPGNHESIATADFLAETYSNTTNIHGYSISTKNVGIFGCGGADFGSTKLSEKQFFNTLNKAHKGIFDKKKKIMVTHMHPAGSNCEFSGFEGSSGIRKAIDKFHPDIAICGHIHEAGGLVEKIGKTKLINVSRTPTIFEI